MSRVCAMAVAGGVIAATASFLTTPAFATDYTASGTIQRSTTTDVSATNLQFRHTGCNTSLSTQGLDGYAFAIPSAYAVDGATVTLSESNTVVHDFGAYVYNSDCSFDRKVVTASTFDLTTRLAPDDAYLVVFSETGSNISIALTAALPTTTTYYDEGAIVTSTPTGVSATDTSFPLTCASPPASQGTDGWVFPLPSSLDGLTVSIASNPSFAAHNFQAAVYDSGCGFLRSLDDTTSSDLSFTKGSADAYVSVWSTSGSNLWPELSA